MDSQEPRRQDQRWKAGLVGGFVVAGLAAGFAVHQAIGADADVKCTLAEAAVFVALAGVFGLLALRAAVFRVAGSGAHKANVARGNRRGERDVGNEQWLVVSG